MDSISIFFPVRNEEENIEKCIEETIEYLEKKALDYEVIVVNDGSTDRTEQIAKRISKRNPRVFIVQASPEAGYASAIKKGIRASSKSLIFFTDADLQFDIEELDTCIDAIKDADYVIGYRKTREENLIQKIGFLLHKGICRAVLGLQVKDVDCDFKLFKADVIKSIEIKAASPFINAEILYRLSKKSYLLKEVCVSHYPRKFGLNKGLRPDTFFMMLLDSFKLKLNILN